ncbi:MAG: DNA gyrase subunit A [Armatimonadetes bacterium CG07_land_8_20_14_0_80_40_9]|nr:MAG: DNA gyrase subunit A [Armatimonadetes bacterium CG07_land_8_20_14_0_80_40_9]
MKAAIEEKIIPIKIEDEIKGSYLDYAMSVIIGRALPDVRDGLKPVHRRILYAMSQLGLTPDKPHKKSARAVGEVLGKFHPHGDVAVYDAMVRMAQYFSCRYPLIDGHGNFGSVDGDSPAAMRYTEVRLSSPSLELLSDLNKETVDFMPNFDESLKEPTVLPSKLPHLLINGSSGIAVGMATNIPPHNLSEIIDGCIMLIDNKEASLEDLMEVIPGPDFPTGGFIWGREGIYQAYSTGRGIFTVQARWEFEEIKEGKKRIVVTELPFQVNKANLVEKIAELMREKKIQGISELRDESDRSGIRIVIELRRDAETKVVLNQLIKYTQMHITFGIIMLALDKGRPRVLNLKEMLSLYLEHRREVVTRRTQYELRVAQERAHILEGLKIALDHLDEVIKTIRSSRTVDIAREALITKFRLTKVQAQAILDLRLQRLTGLERKKIEEEYKELIKKIAYLQDLLGDIRKIFYLIKDELKEMKEKYGDPRRSEIREREASILETEDLIPQQDMIITITRDGYIKRLPLGTYHSQHRGGRGVTGMSIKEEDVAAHLFVATTHHYILFFTNLGLVYRLKAYEVPQSSRQAKGTAIVNLLQISSAEVVTAVIPIKDFDEKHYLFMTSQLGIVKKTNSKEFANLPRAGKIALTLNKGDQLKWVELTDGAQEIILTTEKGQAIRFKENEVRSMGRTARGVRGIRLKGEDKVVGMDIISKDANLLVVTTLGYGKRTKLSKFRAQSRGGSGIKAIKLVKSSGQVVGIKVVNSEEQILLISAEGIVIKMEAKDISLQGRSTQGVRLMRLDANDKVVALESISSEENAKLDLEV